MLSSAHCLGLSGVRQCPKVDPLLGELVRIVPEGPGERNCVLSELPPPITVSRFRDLEDANKEQVKKRAEPLVKDLHAFLNQSSCICDVQRIRRRLNPLARDTPAFVDFAADPEHWYTHNTGGRSEAQFNVGLFPDYFRVGLGFEFSENVFGDPARVQTMFGAFGAALRQRRPAFDRFAQKNSLQVEWRPQGKTGRSSIRYVPTDKVSKWLLRPKVADWIFVGRLLYGQDDAELLEDPVRLKETMEPVFRGLKPLWEEAQTAAAQRF